MEIDLVNLKVAKKVSPPRILVYGPEKIGKTDLLSQMPDTIFFDIEDGSGAATVARYPGSLKTYAEFMAGIQTLAERDHKFSSLVIDTADRLEELIHAQVANEANKKTIADIDWQRGYVTAENIWREVLDAFDYLRNQKGIAIFLISHSSIRRFDDPVAGNYNRYSICLHEDSKGKGSADLVSHWVDATFFINEEVFKRTEEVGFNKKVSTAKSSGNRYIYTTGSPSFIAGNRWKISGPIPYPSTPDGAAVAWLNLQDQMTKGMME